MNIFALDESPKLAAEAHADAHAYKMIVESAQMMSTAAHLHGVWTPEMYKPTHEKHPCTIWVAESPHNREWLEGLVHWLHWQRTGANHKSLKPFYAAYHAMPYGELRLHTPFAQAMPDELRGSNAVEAYRRYYRWKLSQGMVLKYTSKSIMPRKPPSWL